MTRLRHTPGPWTVGKHSMSAVFADKRLVASCAGYSSSDDQEATHLENEANANLVAAAPDLLLALSWLVGLKDGRPTDYEEQKPLAWAAARAALAKATGKELAA